MRRGWSEEFAKIVRLNMRLQIEKQLYSISTGKNIKRPILGKDVYLAGIQDIEEDWDYMSYL